MRPQATVLFPTRVPLTKIDTTFPFNGSSPWDSTEKFVRLSQQTSIQTIWTGTGLTLKTPMDYRKPLQNDRRFVTGQFQHKVLKTGGHFVAVGGKASHDHRVGVQLFCAVTDKTAVVGICNQF